MRAVLLTMLMAFTTAACGASSLPPKPAEPPQVAKAKHALRQYLDLLAAGKIKQSCTFYDSAVLNDLAQVRQAHCEQPFTAPAGAKGAATATVGAGRLLNGMVFIRVDGLGEASLDCSAACVLTRVFP